jgi:Family of unknown function (DUF5871)
MALSMFSTFNVSNVKFSDVRKNAKGGKVVYLNSIANQKLMYQLPALRAPFGLSDYKDETGKVTSYSLALSLDKPEIVAALQALDEKALDYISENSLELLGKKMSRDTIKEGVYKPIVKPATKEGYAPILSLKVLMKDGGISTEAYNSSREQVSLTDLEKGQAVSSIIDINQIWRTPAGVGVTIRVHQVMFAPTNKLKPCAFLATADEPVAAAASDEDETGSVEYETDPDQ